MESTVVLNTRPIYGEVCIRKQRRKRQKRLLLELFLDFAKNTTLHGLRYITEQGLYYIEKIFWLVTFLASVILSFFFIFSVWHKWKTSPVIVSFNAKHVAVNEVPFPSVTICPRAKFLQKTFNYTEVFDSWDPFQEQTKENITMTADMKIANALGLICDIKRMIGVADDITNQWVVETIYNISVEYDDVFYTCKWRGEECKRDMFTKVLTKDGICFNFNGLKSSDILKEEILQKEYNYTLTTENTKGWSMENGYEKKRDNNAYPYVGRDNSDSPNLMLELVDLDSDKDNMCNALYNGYKIFLHHPADLPQTLLYHFAALPKQLTSMGVKFTMETARRSDLEKYPVETRQCYFPEDRPLKFFRIYTYNNCKLECLTLFTYENCGCVSFHMPYINSSQICSVSKMHCVKQAEVKFTEIDEEEMNKCECLPACNTILYDAEIHKTDYNLGKMYDAHIGKWMKYDPSRNKESRVEIFYKEPMFMSVHRSELFGLTDFLGTCGGLLGLFLGFSFLSIVEIFYFMTFRVYRTIRMDLINEKKETSKNALFSGNAGKDK